MVLSVLVSLSKLVVVLRVLDKPLRVYELMPVHEQVADAQAMPGLTVISQTKEYVFSDKRS